MLKNKTHDYLDNFHVSYMNLSYKEIRLDKDMNCFICNIPFFEAYKEDMKVEFVCGECSCAIDKDNSIIKDVLKLKDNSLLNRISKDLLMDYQKLLLENDKFKNGSLAWSYIPKGREFVDVVGIDEKFADMVFNGKILVSYKIEEIIHFDILSSYSDLKHISEYYNDVKWIELFNNVKNIDSEEVYCHACVEFTKNVTGEEAENIVKDIMTKHENDDIISLRDSKPTSNMNTEDVSGSNAEKLLNRIKNLENELFDVDVSFDSLDRKYKDLEVDIDVLKDQLCIFENDCNELEIMNRELQSKYEKELRKTDSLYKELHLKEDEIANSLCTIEQKKIENEKLQEVYSKASEDRSVDKIEINNLSSALNDLRNIAFEDELDFKDNMNVMERSISDLNETVEEKRQMVVYLIEDASVLSLSNENNSSIIQNQSVEIEGLKNQLEHIDLLNKGVIAELEERISVKENILINYEDKIKDLEFYSGNKLITMEDELKLLKRDNTWHGISIIPDEKEAYHIAIYDDKEDTYTLDHWYWDGFKWIGLDGNNICIADYWLMGCVLYYRYTSLLPGESYEMIEIDPDDFSTEAPDDLM